MSQALTRRSLVATGPVAVALAALPAYASVAANADAALLALRGPYERTLAGIEAVSPAHSRAEDVVFATLRAHPDRDRDEVEREVGFDVAEARYEGGRRQHGGYRTDRRDASLHS